MLEMKGQTVARWNIWLVIPSFHGNCVDIEVQLFWTVWNEFKTDVWGTWWVTRGLGIECEWRDQPPWRWYRPDTCIYRRYKSESGRHHLLAEGRHVWASSVRGVWNGRFIAGILLLRVIVQSPLSPALAVAACWLLPIAAAPLSPRLLFVGGPPPACYCLAAAPSRCVFAGLLPPRALPHPPSHFTSWPSWFIRCPLVSPPPAPRFVCRLPPCSPLLFLFWCVTHWKHN